MSQRGELFGESPQACPFIALELDRDQRSDKPDYRHRCFAEPTPQPRAIAHQEAYCLSSEFAACPIFQGWALRAAARPVPVPSGNEARAAQALAPVPTVAEAQAAAAQAPLPADVEPVVPAPGEAWPAETFRPAPAVDTPAQLSVFEPAGGGAPETGADEFPSTWSAAGASPAAPAFLEGGDSLDDAPVPEFLAGRSDRASTPRPRASGPDVPFRETVSREDVIPSWELTDRYGADLNDEHGRRRGRDEGGGSGGDRFGGLLTAIAVVAILALGVAGVLFLPGMLAGRPAATATPAITVAPTFVESPSLPVATTTPLATNGPTPVPSATPEAEATPRLYRIKSGDTLGKIANRFKVTVADILAANPQITDQDHIEPGQEIVIPPS
jgi:LysM repeat protein